MDPQLTNDIVTAAGSLLLTVITGLLAIASKSLRTWLSAQANSAHSKEMKEAIYAYEAAVAQLQALAANAVTEVEQTLVRQLKEDKNWDSVTAQEARDAAAEIVMRHGKQACDVLRDAGRMTLPAIEGLVRTLVENSVAAMPHKSKSPPASPLGFD